MTLDDRRLLVELQSLGVRVVDEDAGALPGRRGGAGPSDALFLWVRGLPLTVPAHAELRRVVAVHAAPRRAGRRRSTATTSSSARSRVPRRPKIYDMETADGVPYWKIALLHLDSIASTVVQKCIYWDTPEQCGFCGIELTRGEQTIPVKTPAQLAEVCTAARDLDHAVDVTLTTGSLNRRDRGAIYISRCAAAIKEACGLPIQVQFEPPDDLRVLEEVQRAGVDAVGIHAETFDPDVLARVAPGKAQCGHRGLLRVLGARGRGVRPRQRDDVRAARDGRAAGADRRGLPARGRDGRLPVRRPAAAGAGHADGRRRRRPTPTTSARIYGEVSAMIADAGLDHLDAKAGCARCQACSGLSAWERARKREEARDGDDLLVGSRH